MNGKVFDKMVSDSLQVEKEFRVTLEFGEHLEIKVEE